MKRAVVKLLATLACSLAAISGVATSGEAGVIPWAYNAIFGPSYNGGGYYRGYYGGASYGPVGYSPMYGGCVTGACGTSTYYGPVAWGGCCPTTCAPCSSGCGPSGCGGVATTYGSTGCTNSVTPATSNPPPGPPSTFEGDNSPRPPRPASAEPGWDATKDRTGTEGDQEFKSPKKGATPPSIPPDEAKGPILNLDEKVAWRPTATRERLPLKTGYANARVVHTPTYAKTDWVPVPSAAKVAAK